MDFPRPSTCLTFPVHKHCPPPPSSTPLSLSPSSGWGLFLTERSFSLCLQQAPSLSPSSHTRLAVAVWSHIFLAWCLTQTPAHRRHSIHTCRITARCSRWSSLICRSCWFSLWAASYEILTCSFVLLSGIPFSLPSGLLQLHLFSGPWSHPIWCFFRYTEGQLCHWASLRTPSPFPPTFFNTSGAKIVLLFFFFCHTAQHVGSQFPRDQTCAHCSRKIES